MSIDLSPLTEIRGFTGGCLVDSETGLTIETYGGEDLDLDLAGARNTEVLRDKQAALQSVGIEEPVEDMLVKAGDKLHMIRPLASMPTVFLYVVLSRGQANLAMARLQLRKIEKTLAI